MDYSRLTQRVQVHSFPMCCGYPVIVNFYRSYELGGNASTGPFQETKDNYKIRIEKQVSTFIKEYKNRKPYFLAAVNAHEYKEGIGDILEKLGFQQLLPLTKNPTGTSVILYAYRLMPEDTISKLKSVFKKKKV